MKRYHDIRDERATNRNWQHRLMFRTTRDQNKYTLQRGRYRKRDGLDCGNTRCALCHADKLFDLKSPGQQRADDSYQQQLDDLKD